MTKGHASECMVRPVAEQPTSHNKKVAACAHFVRSGEHGAGAPRRQPPNVISQGTLRRAEDAGGRGQVRIASPFSHPAVLPTAPRASEEIFTAVLPHRRSVGSKGPSLLAKDLAPALSAVFSGGPYMWPSLIL